MQTMYALELEVAEASSEEGVDAFERLIAHVREWLTYGGSAEISPEELSADGRREVATGPGGAPARSIRWDWLRAERADVVRLQVTQPLGDPGAYFVCRVTAGRVDDAVRLRVIMGRTAEAGIITPVPVETIRRPALVGLVLHDPDLRCQVLGQDVTGRALTPAPGLSAALLDAVEVPRRLPILLVNTVRHDRLEFARRAAQQLAGLAQVVCLRDPADVASFNAAAPTLRLPLGGARLIWPGLDSRHPSFDAAALDDLEGSLERLTRIVSPFAVAARGRDRQGEEALRRVTLEAQQRMRARIEDASARGDKDEEIRLLKDELVAARAELDEFVSAFGAPDEGDGLDRQLAQARAEVEYWRELYLAAQADRGRAAETLLNAPACDDGDFEPLFDHLEHHAGGAIKFTAAGRSSWRRARYGGDVEDMRDALIALTRAAMEWREKQGSIGLVPDDWLKTRYSLNSAFSDGGLVAAHLDKFEFDGRQLSRLPHLKLGDNTTPDKVGRVYFALDGSEWRFVVDHVGLKLYGL